MRVAIHQPEYLPWLGFLHKAKQVDLLILLDDVQFNRASLQQRAKIGDGPQWLTIPFVHKFPQKIDEVRIAGSGWAQVHEERVAAVYARAPAFAEAWPRLEEFYQRWADAQHLAPVTSASVRLLLEAFGVATPVVLSSTLVVDGTKGERVLRLCKAVGATCYLSGASGAWYLDRELFAATGVEIEVQKYAAPVYRDWQPAPEGAGAGLSALDAWVHLGDRARELI